MTIRTTFLFILLAAVPAFSQYTDPSGSPDVIGADPYFDIKSMDLNYQSTDAGTLITATVVLNYNQGTFADAPDANGKLAGFSYPNVSPVLNVGDLLFGVYNPDLGDDLSNTDWSTTQGALPVDWLYAVPLADRPGVTAGHLYFLGGVTEAYDALGQPPAGTLNYRPDAPIWGIPLLKLSDDSDGNSVQVNGTVPYTALVRFLVSKENEETFFAMDRVFFASASCGNDGIYGVIEPRSDTVPEPMTMSLMGAGLVGLAILKRRRK